MAAQQEFSREALGMKTDAQRRALRHSRIQGLCALGSPLVQLTCQGSSAPAANRSPP